MGYASSPNHVAQSHLRKAEYSKYIQAEGISSQSNAVQMNKLHIPGVYLKKKNVLFRNVISLLFPLPGRKLVSPLKTGNGGLGIWERPCPKEMVCFSSICQDPGAKPV